MGSADSFGWSPIYGFEVEQTWKCEQSKLAVMQPVPKNEWGSLHVGNRALQWKNGSLPLFVTVTTANYNLGFLSH